MADVDAESEGRVFSPCPFGVATDTPSASPDAEPATRSVVSKTSDMR